MRMCCARGGRPSLWRCRIRLAISRATAELISSESCSWAAAARPPRNGARLSSVLAGEAERHPAGACMDADRSLPTWKTSVGMCSLARSHGSRRIAFSMPAPPSSVVVSWQRNGGGGWEEWQVASRPPWQPEAHLRTTRCSAITCRLGWKSARADCVMGGPVPAGNEAAPDRSESPFSRR